jgi:two-component system phosphate regulon sensor histidine kinase PhoR
MFSFRQKILLSYVVVFLLFIAFVFPFASTTVKEIVAKAMLDRTAELIAKIQTAPNNEALVRRLKEQKPLIFFRVSVITDERKVIYDSHTKRLLGPRFSQEYVVDHPEILEAIEKGSGYHEDYSDLLGQKFSYFAKAFDFHGKTYIMRTAFPYKYVTELTDDFEIGMISIASVILLLFSALTWFIINHLTRPIQQIIDAVKPYQEGNLLTVPEIRVKVASSDEFGKLAQTLNSLSARIRRQISTLTEERNEKEAILESLTEGVIAIDGNMNISYANQSFYKLLDLQEENLTGKPFSQLKQEKCRQLLMECQKENRPLSDTLEIQRKGPKIYLDLVAAPKKDRSGAILVLQDQTAHYRILEMRKDFIANASHELKTPITIIRGFAETLHDNPGLPEETLVEITSKIVNNCKRMTHLIRDLLALSDIEHLPESKLIECDLEDIIYNCVEMVHNVYPDAEIVLNKLSDESLHLMAEPNLMEMAFINLIENAAKYSTAPAHIHIDMENTGEGNRVVIADQGIGIPPEDLSHIFERFYTVDKAHSRKMGGSGLGLSIVQNIIQKHFGKVTVESEVGKGTTFTIWLPSKK